MNRDKLISEMTCSLKTDSNTPLTSRWLFCLLRLSWEEIGGLETAQSVRLRLNYWSWPRLVDGFGLEIQAA